LVTSTKLKQPFAIAMFNASVVTCSATECSIRKAMVY
jgi:hypothetical protein